MSAQILDGKSLALTIRTDLHRRATELRAAGIVPRLEAVVAAQDPSSLAYVKMKRAWCEKAGIESGAWEVHSETTQEKLIAKIEEHNQNPQVHGVLIQHPLPPHLDENAALISLHKEKDVDGITPQSLGALVCDQPGFRCATPLGIMRLLEHHGIAFEGKTAVVIGRSIILGKPAALLLLQRNATVTIAHSKTAGLPELCRTADILVAAVGRPEMVKGSWIKSGAVVVDAGYNKVEGRKSDVGDVEFESAKEVASWITPVPGGVGPMTVASLLSNTIEAAEVALGR